MPEESLYHPHDKLFRATFSDPANAAAFLRHHLEGPLPDLVDWKSLSALPGTFIAPEMSGFEADLLFSAKIGGSDAMFYILWEHQHTAAPLMGLRLLSYMVRIWQQQSQGQGASFRLAPILPVVLAQDKDRWKTSSQFQDLFGFPEECRETLRGYTPDFAFRLLQLVELSYEEIRGTPEGILTLRSLKAEPLGELLHSLVWDRDVIAGVSREAVERFFRYVLNANVDKEAFKAKVASQRSRNLTILAMTLADRFRQEGHQEGRQEGLREGVLSLQRALLRVLEVRFGAVPEGLREAIYAVSELAALEALLRTSAVCPDLESFAAQL
jgi:predicted transposase/invertase (TIGR01784 family)